MSEALATAAPREIISLRKLFMLAEGGFADPLPSNGGKLLIATDQEGGQLNALGEGFTQFAGPMAIGCRPTPGLGADGPSICL